MFPLSSSPLAKIVIMSTSKAVKGHPSGKWASLREVESRLTRVHTAAHFHYHTRLQRKHTYLDKHCDCVGERRALALKHAILNIRRCRHPEIGAEKDRGRVPGRQGLNGVILALPARCPGTNICTRGLRLCFDSQVRKRNMRRK
jgi:hypothetical protein